MYLETLHLKGFRSLADATITRQPGVTVLAGENNAGKSNVFEADVRGEDAKGVEQRVSRIAAAFLDGSPAPVVLSAPDGAAATCLDRLSKVLTEVAVAQGSATVLALIEEWLKQDARRRMGFVEEALAMVEDPGAAKRFAYYLGDYMTHVMGRSPRA